ncbi:MAG: MATE family efflux transporter [Candidatus Omnitrophica bacterium]|nr:MATE family efflux transporter [Candidatus Omnitrophota bacterium]
MFNTNLLPLKISLRKISAMSSYSKHSPGSIGEMISVALPMMVSFACDTVMIFTDRLFLSKLEPQSMSAAMTGGLSVIVLTSFFLGLIGYATALVAQFLGAGKKAGCSSTLTQTVVVACVAYPVILLMVPMAHWIFAHSGIDSYELQLQTQYFDILVLGSIFTLLRHALSSYFTGIGRTKIVMLGALIAMSVNVALNYIFVFGKFGCPAMGVKGAALGTIIATGCAIVVMSVIYFSKRNVQEFYVADSLRFDSKIMRKLWHYGYPGGIEMLFNLIAFTAMVFVLHSEGLVAAAAITMVFNWELVAYIPLVGIEMGVTSLVGRYMGAQNVAVVKSSIASGVKVGLFYSFLMVILFVFLPHGLVQIFEPQSSREIFIQAVPLAIALVKFVAFYVSAQSVFMVFIGALRGAGDTLWAMGISVGIHWILLTLLVLMLKVWDFSVYQSWVTMISVFLAMTCLPYLRYRTGRWKSIHVVDPVLD